MHISIVVMCVYVWCFNLQADARGVFTGKESFDEAKWEKLLLQILVATSTSKLIQAKHQSQARHATPVVELGIVQNVIEVLKTDHSNKEQLYK